MAKNTSIPKGRTAAEALITGGAIAAVLVLVNVLGAGSRARFDLTEQHIYSLSDASEQMVAGMKEKVNIKAYFGNVPAEYAEKQTYVDMLLSEYADRSGGMITYEKIDPWGNKELMEELRKDGVDQLRLQTVKDESYEQVPVYFHVVFSHLDKKEVWTPGRVFALEGLEYEYTSRIKRLAFGKQKVGVTVGFGEPPQVQVLQAPGAAVPWVPGAKVGLADLYEVTPVNWKDTPKALHDVDVLIVNGPTETVSDAAKVNLDQYIMAGKPVLFLVGGMRWQAGNGQPQAPGFENPDDPYVGMPASSGLGDLLEGYGFKIGQDVILDLKSSARGWLPPGARQGMLARGVFPYARSLAADEGGILQGIDVVAVPFASTLKLVGSLADAKGDDPKVLKLLETMPSSWAKADVMAITKDLKLAEPEGEHGPYLVAVAVAGTFKSFYADHPVPAGVELPAAAPAPAAPGEAAPTGPLKESASHTRLVVISAPSLVADPTLLDVQMHGDAVYVNGFLAAHNVVDWLLEDTALIAVRSKKFERPIGQLEAGQKTLIKYGNVVGAPLLLIIAGVVAWRVRERKRRNIVL